MPYRELAQPEPAEPLPSKECPRCGLSNEPHRERCDCGFRLNSSPADVNRMQIEQADRALLKMVAAAILFGATIVISAMTLVATRGILLWLPIGGFALTLRAFFRWRGTVARRDR